MDLWANFGFACANLRHPPAKAFEGRLASPFGRNRNATASTAGGGARIESVPNGAIGPVEEHMAVHGEVDPRLLHGKADEALLMRR